MQLFLENSNLGPKFWTEMFHSFLDSQKSLKFWQPDFKAHAYNSKWMPINIRLTWFSNLKVDLHTIASLLQLAIKLTDRHTGLSYLQQARKGIFNLLSSFRADIQNLGILKSCRNLGLIRLENVVEVNQDFVTRKMATEVMILHSLAMANPLLGNRTYLVPRRGSSGRRKFGGVAAQSVPVMAAAFPSASTELLRKSGYSSVKKQGSRSAAVHRTNSVTRPRVVADSAREFAATAIVEKTAEEHSIINPSEALLEKFAHMPPSDIGETTAADRLFLWEDVAKLGKLQPCKCHSLGN